MIKQIEDTEQISDNVLSYLFIYDDIKLSNNTVLTLKAIKQKLKHNEVLKQ